MSSSSEFNVTAAAAIVLGGIAAIVLALAVVLGGFGQGARAKAAFRSTGDAPSAATVRKAAPPANASEGRAVPETEVEYPLDTSDPGSSTR
jgi:hypothetical protein